MGSVKSKSNAATSILSYRFQRKNKHHHSLSWLGECLRRCRRIRPSCLACLVDLQLQQVCANFANFPVPQTIVNRTKKTYQKIKGYPYYSTSFANQKSLNTTPHCIQVPTNGQNKWRLFYCGLYVEPWLYAASTLFYPFLPLKLQTVFFLNFTLFRDSKVIVFPSVEHVQTVVSLCH